MKAAGSWPGHERRHPSLSSSMWAVRAPLAAWLLNQAQDLGRAGSYRVLDVGCGPKPYFPFFAEHATEYVGVDMVDNPVAELRANVESLPVADGSFDVVLCTQVLEHTDDPAQAVRELRRVTAPGGRVLASTHGVQLYHPSPVDHWRWTHTGLKRLFEQNGDWESISVEPASGTAGCLAMLLARYVEIGFGRARVPSLARGPVWLLNSAAGALDRRVGLLREPRPGSLTANFHVVAVVPR